MEGMDCMDGLTIIEKSLIAIEKKYGVSVLVKDMYSFMQSNPNFYGIIRRFYSHNNPYCVFIKSKSDAIGECTRFEHTEMGRHMNLNPDLYENGRLITCCFGVKEFYYPIRCANHTIGALVFGSDCCEDDEFASHYEENLKRFNISFDEAKEKYKSSIKKNNLFMSEDFLREASLCGEFLSMLCDRMLAGVNIDGLFRYNYILNNNNSYLNLESFASESRILSKDGWSENRAMTIVLNAVSYIHNHYTKKITIDDIARYCFCSSSTLSHVFAKNYGMTIGKLINTVRCDRAKTLLRETDLSINQIARECGFSNRDYFASVFRKNVGITPTEFREINNKI